MLTHKPAHFVGGHTALIDDAGNLKLSCRRSDVRIEARPGGTDKIHRDWRVRILFTQRTSSGLHIRIEELLAGRSQVSATGPARIVSTTGSGWPGMKVARARECLSDQTGPDDLAVLLNEASRGFCGKHHLRESSDNQGVDDSEQHGEHHGHRNRWIDLFEYVHYDPLFFASLAVLGELCVETNKLPAYDLFQSKARQEPQSSQKAFTQAPARERSRQ